MKSVIKKYWQLLIPFLLYFPYVYLHGTVFLDWFGCSCPKIDEYGNTLVNQFNVNNFAQIFWLAVLAILILISVFKLRKINGFKNKLFFICVSCGLSVLFSFICLLLTPIAR